MTNNLCELRQLAIDNDWPRCDHECQTHHVWNKSKWPKNKQRRRQVKKLVEDIYPYIFLADVCPVHNRDRWADTSEARNYLLRKRLEDYETTEQALEEVRACYKVPPPELRLEAIR